MLFRDKFMYFLPVLVLVTLTPCLTWLRFNEIEERLKLLEHDITTLSQPVDISTYTDQLSSIKESIATHSERLSLLETHSHPNEFKRINQRLNEIQEQMKLLEHNITTLSQPVDISNAIKKNITFLETHSHPNEFKQINKRLNKIEKQMKQLEHDITTLSQPVDISNEFIAIKKNITFLETHSHPNELKKINKRFNEIEKRMKLLEHDITTLSQPVDISTYTDQLSSIKESVANHSERLSLLETLSHPEQKGTVYTTTEVDKLLNEIKNALNKQIQDVRDQCMNELRNQHNDYEHKINELKTTYNSITSTNEKKVENIIYYMYKNYIIIPIFSVLLLISYCCICCVYANSPN